MALYVDRPLWQWRGMLWAHMIVDTTFDDLHAVACELRIPERAFDGDHYDVPEERWEEIVEYGAVPVSSREIVRLLRQAGLRSPKHLRRRSGIYVEHTTIEVERRTVIRHPSAG